MVGSQKVDRNFGLFCSLVETPKKEKALVLNGSMEAARTLSKEFNQVFILKEGKLPNTSKLQKAPQADDDCREIVCFQSLEELRNKGKAFDLIAVKNVGRFTDTGGKIDYRKDNLIHLLSFLARQLTAGGKLVIGFDNLLDHGYWKRICLSKIKKKAIQHEVKYPRFPLWGCKKILIRSGYSNIKFSIAVPIYTVPVMTCDLNSRSLAWFYKKLYPLPETRIERSLFMFLQVIKVVHYFLPSYLAVAEKE